MRDHLAHVNTKGMETLSDGRVRLRGASAGKKFGVGLVWLGIAVLWNGLWWTAAIVTLSGDGPTKWVWLAIVSIPILIGAGLAILAVVAMVQAVMVGRKISPPVLTIDRLPLRLGEKFKVVYEQQTRKQCEINKVTVTLTCLEWVQFTVGTGKERRTKTLEHTACEHEEILTENVEMVGAEPIKGEAEFAIAADAMHSFDSGYNKIKWFLKLHTDIADWPDYSDDIAIAVSPRIVEERA